MIARPASKSIRYAFTVTLNPKLYNEPASQQFDKSSEELFKHLVLMFNANFVLVSELTKNYNIHYHGSIEFIMIDVKKYNLMKRFVDSFRKSKLFGFVNIKPIDNEPIWIDYIGKEFHNFCSDTNRRPILKDDFDYWDSDQYQIYGSEW